MSGTHQYQCRFPATQIGAQATLNHITRFLHGTARVHDVELALAEAFANLVQHAFRGTGSGEIQVTKSPDGGVACTLTDYGCEYHPPDGTPDGIMRESGYGWKLLHALTTTITYTRAQNQNRLCMNF